jgi:hypothetical protein
MPLLRGFQFFGARFSGLFVSDKLEGDFLSVIKAVHACAFDRAYMHEDVFCAVSRFWRGRQSGALFAARPSRSAETRWTTYGYDLLENKIEIVKRHVWWATFCYRSSREQSR